jgi:hypothetical protein
MRGSSPDGLAPRAASGFGRRSRACAAPAVTDPIWRGTLKTHGAERPVAAVLPDCRRAARRRSVNVMRDDGAATHGPARSGGSP